MSDSPLPPGSDAEWEALLAQLRQQPPAQPQPFFYTRVQARLQTRRAAPLGRLPGWLRRPAYAALLGALVLAVSGDGAALRAAPVASHSAPVPRTLTR